MIKISRKNPLPLYVQLKQIIVENVENGYWLPGTAIPTELELQELYELSRTTVRQALGELVSDGTLTRIQGKGTFVAEPKIEPTRPELTGFTEDMKERGFLIRSEVTEFSVQTASEKLQREFNLNPTSEVLHLKRIRFVDDQPLGFQTALLNLSLDPNLYEKLSKYDFTFNSLYDVLAKEGIYLGEADETVEAGIADGHLAELLEIETGAPVLLLTRLTKLKDGRPFEYSKMVYRADRYKYSIKLG